MESFRIISLLILVLFASSLMFVLHHRSIHTERNTTIAVKTPQSLMYFKPKPINHVYERHMTAANVTFFQPIIVAVVQNSKTVFLMRMTIEQKNSKPIVSIWLSQ